jgi:hypothetical protein
MKRAKKTLEGQLRYIMSRLNWLCSKENPTESEILKMKELYVKNLNLIKRLETKQLINSN